MDKDVTECAPSTSHDEETNKQLDTSLLVYSWLSSGPFKESAAALRAEIEKTMKCPPRIDYLGNQHERSLSEYEEIIRSSVGFANGKMLPEALKRLHDLSNSTVPPAVSGLPFRLFDNPRNSLVRTQDSIKNRDMSLRDVFRRDIPSQIRNRAVLLEARDLGRNTSSRRLPGPWAVEQLDRHFRVHGHVANAYCVSFDRTGRYALTGADDSLVKVWDTTTGYLRYTFRGHKNEISDMCVSPCNQMLATGSVDKTVRIWSMQSGAMLRIFKTHTSSLVRVVFLPFVPSSPEFAQRRFFVSCAFDCQVIFMAYNCETLEFQPNEICIFEERDAPGNKMISLTHSPCGQIIVCGDTRCNLKLFRIVDGTVQKLQEIVGSHSEKIDSLYWSNASLRFATGSLDGTVKIFKFYAGRWNPITIELSGVELETAMREHAARVENAVSERNRGKFKYKVTMLCWTLDENYLITAGSDNLIRVWDASTGVHIRKYKLHIQEVYVLRAHPVCPQLFISGGYDGVVAVWNLELAQDAPVWKYTNTIDQRGVGAITDIDVREDGSAFAVADTYGQLSLFGLGENGEAKKVPKQQFFNTDYDPLAHDDEGLVVDEISGLPPHLMPPPLLRNADDTLWEPEFQRRVPGRENLKSEEIMRVLVGSSVWSNSEICPRLTKGEIQYFMEEMAERGEIEKESYDKEMSRQIVIDYEEPIVMANDLRRRANVRNRPRNAGAAGIAVVPNASRRRQFNLEQAMREQDALRARNELNGYRSSEDESYSGSSGSAIDSDDSTDSDFSIGRREARRHESENEVVEEQVVTTSSGRRVRRVLQEEDVSRNRETQQRRVRRNRRAVIEDDDESEADERLSQSQDEEATTQRRRRGRRESAREQVATDDMAEEHAGPSTEPTAAETAVRKRSKKLKDNWLNQFPSWMSACVPRRFPYFAQLGDRVVYFRQGHENYIRNVVNSKLYLVTNRMLPSEDLSAEEFCIVDDLRYTRKPYRLTVVNLAQIDQDGRRTGLKWSVKFHDLENSPDFIVPLRLFEDSKAMNLEDGVAIEAIIDGTWWTGTVHAIAPFSDEFPRSSWFCVKVKWDTGEDDVLSPWDVQIRQANRRSGISATEEEEIEFASFGSFDDDWPVSEDSGMTVDQAKRFHCDRLMHAIRSLGENEIVSVFNAPVDVDEFPIYPMSIDYPIDLSTICERLENGFYRSITAMQRDVRGIATAAEQFNCPESVIVRNARLVVEAIIRFSRDTQVEDIVALFVSLFDEPSENIVEYRARRSNRTPQEQDSATLADAAGPSNVSVSQMQRDGWVNQAMTALRDVMRDSSARCFLSATQQEEEEMFEALSSTTDLQTILNDLENSDKYTTPHAVSSIFEEMIRAVRESFDDKRSAIYKASVALANLFSSRMRHILEDYDRRMSTLARAEALNGNRMRLRNSGARRAAAVPVYHTRRADALLSSRIAVDEAGLTSRNAHVTPGFYRNLLNGDRFDDEPTSSRRRPAPPTSTMSRTRRPPVERSMSEESLPSSSARSAVSVESSAATQRTRRRAVPIATRTSNRRRREEEALDREVQNELMELVEDSEERMRTSRRRNNVLPSDDVEEGTSESSEAEDSDDEHVEASGGGEEDEEEHTHDSADDSQENEEYSSPSVSETSTRRRTNATVRRSTRQRKRRRVDSDDDEDENVPQQRRPRRACVAGRSYATSDDEVETSVSSRGRVRRLRHVS